jgi:hypothetical protein
MAARCPRCRGTRFVGRGKDRGPCPACNADAVGDKVIGAVQRTADRIAGRSLNVDSRTTTSRTGRFGTETTRTRAPRKRQTGARIRKPTAAAAAAVVLPACDRCGTHGPLTVTSRGAVCAGGCPA